MTLLERIIAFFDRKKPGQSVEKEKTGFIKSFNRSRGYGFIYSKDLSKRIFVHITEIKDRFRVGDRVKFELSTNSKGFIAKNVVKIQSANG
ncbi:MAG: cold shock domain-containing protein [Bacteroidetes bacterium]|nr:cold shock domain-containing protein [Bacteroidota bacterium]